MRSSPAEAADNDKDTANNTAGIPEVNHIAAFFARALLSRGN